jgi:SAM-dependent methyltransferase
MLREHLDESHGAASRPTSERELQIDWLWSKLKLHPGSKVLDVTCGPGLYAVSLAERGCEVTGIDFSPAAAAYARELSELRGVSERCTFQEQDVRKATIPDKAFDAALFIYGQLAVFSRQDAQFLLEKIAKSLKPSAYLCVELLDQSHIDKQDSTWWFTDDSGLWGNRPFLHLGERFWLEEEDLSIERYQIIHLENGNMTEILLCDQTYSVETSVNLLQKTGYYLVDVYPAWGGLSLNDAEEWVVYIAQVA